MSINFYLNRFLKFLSICFILSFSISEINTINKHIYAEKNFIAASEMVKNSKNEKAQIKFKKSLDYFPFKLDDNLEVIKIAKESANKIGINSKTVAVNGGLDANWLIRNGIPTITFGNGHYNPHSLDEYLDIKEYEDSCELAISIATQ